MMLLQQNKVQLLLEKIRSIRTTQFPFVICIDGSCCAGKTSLATALAKQLDALLIHMDDYYLPLSKRPENFLNSVDGPIDQQRFLKEVVDPICHHRGFFHLYRFDCMHQEFIERGEFSTDKYIIIEGSYSHHPLFSLEAYKVFVDIDPNTQLKRIEQREGRNRLEVFQQMWIPLEQQYQHYYEIKMKADFIIELD